MSMNIQKLEDVARIRDSDRRRELLSAVADLFLSGDAQKTSRERALFSDIFLRTIDDLDMDGRQLVSEQLAASADTPHSVAMRLATDEATVADPVLRLSPVLDDEDLVEVAKGMSNDHLVSISHREQLSPKVTDVLIDRGDSTVIRTVSANDGAQFSPNGFKTLAGKAKDDTVVQQNLSERVDIPEDMLKRVLPQVSDNVALRIREAFTKVVDKTTVKDALGKADKAFASAKLESSRSRVEARVAAKDIAAGRREAIDVFREFARDEKFIELVTILADLVDLPEGLVADLMYRTENAPFVIMCRSVDLPRAAFVVLSDLRCRRLKLPSSHGNHAISEFDGISVKLANRLIRFVNFKMAV